MRGRQTGTRIIGARVVDSLQISVAWPRLYWRSVSGDPRPVYVEYVIEILRELTDSEIRHLVRAQLSDGALRESFEARTRQAISRDTLLLEAARVIVRQRRLDAV